MLPIGAVFAFIGRQLGRILSLAFSWGTVALFGRVREDRQVFLALMAASSLLWPVIIAGVAVPSIATFLLAFVTIPGWADRWVRPVVLALALLLPIAVGFLSTKLTNAQPRAPSASRRRFVASRTRPASSSFSSG